jgi:CheY-like chemotaxis protein
MCRDTQSTLLLQKGIALSGYGLEEDVRRTLEAGFDVHLTKPVHFATLSAAIHDLLFRPSA